MTFLHMISDKKHEKIPAVLTVAGSDSSGGAGIQADLKTFAAFDCLGLSAITALTAQNTKKVKEIYDVSPAFVFKQIDAVAKDFNIDAVKTGMLVNEKIIEKLIMAYHKFNFKKLVVDPVMISGSGKRLLSKKAVEKMVRELFPLAEVVTPNVEEASFLVKKEIKTVEEMKEAAYKIKDFGSKWVVIKGGHLKEETATDIYFDGNRIYCEKSKRLSVRNVHGTGCTFASAVAALLAQNKTMPESVKKAKEYVRRLIKTAHFPSSDGFGLMSHFS